MTGNLSGDDHVLVQVALPAELLDDIDQYAYREGTNRSAVVTAALEE